MDITAEFLESCKELKLGEVVSFSGFNMADAMSAIEIMDPKMDMGMQPFDESLSLENFVKTGKVNVTKVELDELVALIDATLAMVVSWLHGQSLDQTVFTNICLLDLERLEDPILAGFCSAIVNLIHCIKSCIESASVFSEEDYSPHSCRLEVKSAFWTPLEDLNTAVDFVQTNKSNKSQSKLDEAIENRLCLVQSLFDLFTHLLPSSSSSSPNFRKGAQAVERGLLCVTNALRTVALGKQPPHSASGDGNFSWMPHFQPDVNRYVLPPSFPRTPKVMNRVDSLKYIQNFLQTIKHMIADLQERMRCIEGLIDFFQMYGGDKSCTLSRAFAQLLVLPHDYKICGMNSLADIIQDSLKRLDIYLSVENPSLSLLGDKPLEERILSFVMYCVRVFVSVFQMYGHNMGRQRDKLMRHCFEDFGVLQLEAADIEEQCTRDIRKELETSDSEMAKTASAPSVLSSFVLFHVLRLMHYHFETGFRLDLFVPYEFPYVYWYFGEIVSSQLASIMERRCSLAVLNFGRQMAALEAKKPSKKLQLRHRAEAELRKSISQTQTAIFRHKIEVLLCQAFVKFACALRLAGRLPTSLGNNVIQEMLRYMLRFDVFGSLASAPTTLNVPYDLYRSASGLETLMVENNAERVFAMANDHFEEAVSFMKNLESQDESPLDETTRLLVKTAKQNAIVSKLLSHSPDMKKKIVFDNIPNENPTFPLIRLV